MAEALQFVIEIGHKASTLKEPIGDFIYKWNLFLRSGDERQQIDKVVQKVVFNLHETFKNPTRECTQPPYCVKENGYGEFEFPIDIFFNGTGEKYTINYFLDLPPAQSLTPLYRFRKEVITFVDPNPEFRKLLIESGATVKKILSNCSATTSLKKKANSSSVLNSSLNSPNTSVNSPNSSLVNLNSSKLNQAINGTSFLATHSAFPSEKKKNSSKKSLIRNDLSSQSPKPPSSQSTPIDTTSKAIANPASPPKKQNLNRTTPDPLAENKELLPKTLVKHKSKLNAITNNDELDKPKNDLDVSNLSAGSKKRPFVQSNESLHTDSNKFDENKKKIQSEPELKFKKIKSSNKIMASCDTKTKAVENEHSEAKLANKKAKNEPENLLSTISSIISPPPSHSTNGTSSCTSSVSSSCNYNTSPTSLSSLCLNKEPNKLKTKPEFEDKMDKEELKKIRRRKNSANSDKDEDEYRKERDRDKHRRSSNHTQRRSHKRRNSNDYENDSDADSYYSYKNGHSRHHSKEAKPKTNRNGSVNAPPKSKPDDDETSSTVSSVSNSSSSSGEKNYKKYSESKYSQNKQPTNHNREPREPTNDADYIQRMLKLYDKIAFVHSSKQFDLLAKICGLVKPFSFTENSLFNFDLFTLDLSVVEKLEGLVVQSAAQFHSVQNNSASTLDTSRKNKNNELVKT